MFRDLDSHHHFVISDIFDHVIVILISNNEFSMLLAYCTYVFIFHDRHYTLHFCPKRNNYAQHGANAEHIEGYKAIITQQNEHANPYLCLASL